MGTAARPRHDRTFADVLALGGDAHVELIEGEIVPKAGGSFIHGRAQGAIGAYVNRLGWRCAHSVDVELSPRTVVRPDVAGWRRDVARTELDGLPVRVVPHWVCEVLSPEEGPHLAAMAHRYHAARVPHYWTVDPDGQVLQVFRWCEDGYALLLLAAGATEVVCHEPFESEVSVAALLGLDEA